MILPGFFLDSVDELKLKSETLKKALRNFEKSIRGCLDRAHVVISCRPNDWRIDTDDVAVEEGLRITPPTPETLLNEEDAEEYFLELLRKGNHSQRRSDEAADCDAKKKTNTSLQTYFLIGLSEKQIRFFAEEAGVSDTNAFLAEVDFLGAWPFVRRPLDLLETIDHWNHSGTLGTLKDRHERNITTRLKEFSDRPDKGVLSDQKAREGAERLALAQMLSRRYIIQSLNHDPHTPHSARALDPEEILSDWTQAERETLLRRGLFDPATYGRIRFHNRSVQEYLAARRLHTLVRSGLSMRALYQLLFAEKYNQKVLIPSMRPVTAWLSLWNDTVCGEVVGREPEVLLSLGDTGSLPSSARIKLLRAFVSRYSKGGWRGLRIPLNSLQRLTCPELVPVIKELWTEGSSNPDVRKVLLELIWRGKMTECLDIALKAARNTNFDENTRALAIHALIACQQIEDLQILTSELVSDRNDWPAKLVHLIAAELFPEFLSVSDLIKLIKDIPEPRSSTTGFSWELRFIIEGLEPESCIAKELRNSLTELIWEGRDTDKKFYELFSKYEYLSADLADICCRQFENAMGKADPAFIRSCTVAVLFTNAGSYRTENAQKLRELFQNENSHRDCIFRATLELLEKLAPEKNAWGRYHQLFPGGLLNYPSPDDSKWLEDIASSSTTKTTYRAVALEALLVLWRQNGRNESEAENLRQICSDNSFLKASVFKDTAPPDPKYAEEERRLSLQRKQREHESQQREADRLQSDSDWRRKVIDALDEAFSEERRHNTLESLYSWLRQASQTNNKRSVWNKEALSKAFSIEFADRAEAEFCQYWRETQPTLWSFRKPEERNLVYRSTSIALTGLAAERLQPNWYKKLTEEEVKTAVSWTLQELNGFAAPLTDLVEHRPTLVEEVLSSELTHQLKMVDSEQHLQMLHDLSYAESNLKSLLASYIVPFLKTLPENTQQPEASNLVRHLEHVLRILSDARDAIDTKIVIQFCSDKYKKAPGSYQALTWLQGLFWFDLEKGTQVLSSALADKAKPTQKQAIASFARLFGGRNSFVFDGYEPGVIAKCLSTLLKTAYTFMPPDSDPVHDGTFTPDLHDDAVTGKNFLLNQLLELPGPEAQAEINSLAEHPLFSHIPDRLKLLARGRAALDAEFSPLTYEQINSLETAKDLLPYDRDSLFAVMMDRLGTLAIDLAEHDFTDRKTLKSIKQEEDMQKALAMKLHYLAQGAYIVSREDEVADSKRTDIRLSAVCGDRHKAAIELKLADKWTIKDFERALEAQLIGQYLRHPSGKAGCLLLTYHGNQKYWIHPETKKHLSFADVVSMLNDKAVKLEAEHQHNIRVSVFGLDLTDPVLASAHG